MGVFKPFKELYAFGCESPDEICPLYLARFTNFIFGTANFFLIYLIQSNLNSKYLVSIWSPNFGRPFLKVQKDFNRLYRLSTDSIPNILQWIIPSLSVRFLICLSLSLPFPFALPVCGQIQSAGLLTGHRQFAAAVLLQLSLLHRSGFAIFRSAHVPV